MLSQPGREDLLGCHEERWWTPGEWCKPCLSRGERPWKVLPHSFTHVISLILMYALHDCVLSPQCYARLWGARGIRYVPCPQETSVEGIYLQAYNYNRVSHGLGEKCRICPGSPQREDFCQIRDRKTSQRGQSSHWILRKQWELARGVRGRGVSCPSREAP